MKDQITFLDEIDSCNSLSGDDTYMTFASDADVVRRRVRAAGAVNYILFRLQQVFRLLRDARQLALSSFYNI